MLSRVEATKEEIMNHKPATALPWLEDRRKYSNASDVRVRGPNNACVTGAIAYPDAAYIAHSANLYGPLVEALRALDPNHPVLKQAGEA